MVKQFLFFLLTGLTLQANGQIQIAKLVGKNSNDYTTGYGGFLKYAYPVSEGNAISLEAGALIFNSKADSRYGWIVVPFKAGYRYTFNQTGSGFYVEPQLGYNVYGLDPEEQKFHGVILGAGTGYIFQPIAGTIQFDLGLRYESVVYKGNTVNYVSVRLTHNFSIGKRQE